MKIFKLMILIIVANLSLISACKKELIEQNSSIGNKELYVSLNTSTTRSNITEEATNKLTNIKLGIYCRTKLIDQIQVPVENKDRIVFRGLKEGDIYNIYAIVNMPDKDFPQNESNINSIYKTIPTYNDINSSGMYMAGAYHNISISSASKKIEIHIKRLFTRIELGFNTTENIENIRIISAKFEDANSQVYLFANSELANTQLITDCSNKTFSKQDKLILYAPEAFKVNITKTKLNISAEYVLEGKTYTCGGTINIGKNNNNLIRNTKEQYELFTLFPISKNEGGIIIDPWETPTMYVAQTRSINFKVTGSSNFDVNITEGGRIMSISKTRTRASEDYTNVSLKIGGLSVGTYNIEIKKNGKITDTKQFKVVEPKLCFNKDSYNFSYQNNTLNCIVTYIDSVNKPIQFNNVLYRELLKPNITLNPDLQSSIQVISNYDILGDPNNENISTSEEQTLFCTEFPTNSVGIFMIDGIIAQPANRLTKVNQATSDISISGGEDNIMTIIDKKITKAYSNEYNPYSKTTPYLISFYIDISKASYSYLKNKQYLSGIIHINKTIEPDYSNYGNNLPSHLPDKEAIQSISFSIPIDNEAIKQGKIYYYIEVDLPAHHSYTSNDITVNIYESESTII